jgi:hypothetical protein
MKNTSVFFGSAAAVILALTLTPALAAQGRGGEQGRGDSPKPPPSSAAVLIKPGAAVFAAVSHAFSGTPAVDGGPWIAGGLSLRLARR